MLATGDGASATSTCLGDTKVSFQGDRTGGSKWLGNQQAARAESKGEKEAAQARRLSKRSHTGLLTPLPLLRSSMAPQCHLNKNNASAGHPPLRVPHDQPY